MLRLPRNQHAALHSTAPATQIIFSGEMRSDSAFTAQPLPRDPTLRSTRDRLPRNLITALQSASPVAQSELQTQQEALKLLHLPRNQTRLRRGSKISAGLQRRVISTDFVKRSASQTERVARAGQAKMTLSQTLARACQERHLKWTTPEMQITVARRRNAQPFKQLRSRRITHSEPSPACGRRDASRKHKLTQTPF